MTLFLVDSPWSYLCDAMTSSLVGLFIGIMLGLVLCNLRGHRPIRRSKR